MHKPKVLLVIMDGWGYSPIEFGNAIAQAKKPTVDFLWKNYAHTLLNSFGQNVGLPWGSIGSSEVGHTSIGSGQLVNQELSKIDKEIASGNFFKNKEILELIKKVQARNGSIHLAGLVSNGGVHSHMEHLFSLLEMLKQQRFKDNIFIHVCTDGRDTSPKSAIQYITDLEENIRKINVNAKISTIIGRYYAMDRDNNWDRTEKAYLAMTQGEGTKVKDYFQAIKSNYEKNIGDEFIPPMIIDNKTKGSKLFSYLQRNKSKSGFVEEGDGLIFFNIRPDRMRQISDLFASRKSSQAIKSVPNLEILSLTTYSESLPFRIAYPSQKITNPLAKILSDHGITQAHFAESEKYAHVTYFFNGGNDDPFPGESWYLVPSPKVATYDKAPEMSAKKITDKLFDILEKKKIDFALINYANCDMVGHTGNLEKEIVAVETIDKELKRLLKLLPETTIIITADHGNGECMIHPETKEIDKKHTVNPVPFIIINEKFKKKYDEKEAIRPSGILADIAPTILKLFNIDKSSDMNGVDLAESLE